MEEVFEINETSQDNKIYLLSDLEDSLSYLSPSRISRIISKFGKQLSLIGDCLALNPHTKQYKIKLQKINGKYWIEAQSPINTFLHIFFAEIIRLQNSSPDTISKYINETQAEVHHKVFRTRSGSQPDEFVNYIFILRTVKSLYFRETTPTTQLEIKTIENSPYLSISFFADKLDDSSDYYQNDDKYEKRYLRLNKSEEQVKKLLEEGSKADIISHKGLILETLERNHLFQRECLDSSEAILTCFKSEFTEVLNRVYSVHFSEDFYNGFPEVFWEMKQLKRIYIRGSKFKTLPPQLGILKDLSYISISDAEISQVSAKISGLEKLKTLWLHDNKLSQFPSELGALNLEELCLDNNPIIEIPDFISKLKQIKWIRITDCRLQSINPFIGQLETLEHINLRRNKIKEIPIELLKSKSLKHLEIAYNPFDLKRLKEFKELKDEINPDLRIDIFEDGHFKLDL
jgi:Leucine-rich repeat (LRR) protein